MLVKTSAIGLFAILGAAVSAVALAQTATDAASTDMPVREEIIVTGNTPLPGSNVDKDKLPGTSQLLSANDFAKNHGISILDTLSQRIPGLQLSDSQGNAGVQDLHYRGFAASPLQGTPQGIAVYQDGVRLNEAFGDTVNWDLIPAVAIDRFALSSNNPAFGLNAIGGAVSLSMKNGFTFQGLEGEIQGGSFGRVNGSIQYGVKSGKFSLYIAAEAFKDNGWRQLSSSDIERIYADAGFSGDISEFHLIASAARSSLGVVGPAPLDLINANDKAVYTSPQATKNEIGMLALNGTVNLTDSLAIQTNVYGRHLEQKHIDGNGSNFESCSTGSSFGGTLCLEDNAFGTPVGGEPTAFRNQFAILDRSGRTIPFVADTPYGTIDKTSTNTTTLGAALQATYDAPVFGHTNNFVFGGSIDHSDIVFSSSSTLGYIFPDLSVGLNGALPGSGAVIHTLGNLGYAPVALAATTDYYGIYAANTFDVTDRLSATVGIRVNIIGIDSRDTTGADAELNANHSYTHANPQAGLTYKLGGGVTAYGGFSQSNRAPTALELDCADPVKPCLLENSLVSDPPLKQVVADNYEIGLRGSNTVMFGTSAMGRLDWNIAFYRTDSNDDIIALASVVQGRGYYTNVPATRRQGLEIGGNYVLGSLTAFANYSFVDATYRFNGVLASPNSPAADGAGNITVHSGNRLPAIPRHQVKVGADYAVTPDWTIGGDVEYFGSQYLVGDGSNQNARLTPYVVANVRSSYQLTDDIQIFGHIDNLLDRRYASYGTYFETAGVGQPITSNLSDPRSLTLGRPRSFAGGIKVKF
ncbi:MAG: TonB-dependent receptor [Rhodospirillales bacterium]|nr:TonB-dependent receptor [Rhodospirillales bacterium]